MRWRPDLRHLLNRADVRRFVSARPARGPGLGGKTRYVVIGTYSHFRHELCRIPVRTHFGAWWIARRWVSVNSYGHAWVFRRDG